MNLAMADSGEVASSSSSDAGPVGTNWILTCCDGTSSGLSTSSPSASRKKTSASSRFLTAMPTWSRTAFTRAPLRSGRSGQLLENVIRGGVRVHLPGGDAIDRLFEVRAAGRRFHTRHQPVGEDRAQ